MGRKCHPGFVVGLYGRGWHRCANVERLASDDFWRLRAEYGTYIRLISGSAA